MAAASREYVYGSEYERLVLTTGHPIETKFMKLENPPYIASSRWPWLAIRQEELMVVLFLSAVFGYVAAFYTGVYFITYPIQLCVAYSWDLMLGCLVLLRLHGRTLPRLPSRKAIAQMPVPEQEDTQRKKKAAARAYTNRRNTAFMLCAAAALVRWYHGWGDVRVLLA